MPIYMADAYAMISLKKTMEEQREELLASALGCYRSAVGAMADSGAQVCPSLGAGFRQSLMALRERLAQAALPGALSETEKDIEESLEGWGKSATEYYKQKTAEVRELLLHMTEAAQSVVERDQRYKTQFSEVTARLQTANNLEDLTQIRKLIGDSSAELRFFVDRMVEDGQKSMANLRQKLAVYEERLKEAERQSSLDPLTGLVNRPGMERETAARLERGQMFCLVVMDLNGFKKINDDYGHQAGDTLLKSFAAELKAQFRSNDAVGRWGGDEFVVLLDCDRREAETRVERVRKWAFGNYEVQSGGKARKVAISGAVGITAWQPGKTAEQMFADADRAMYADKGSARR